jgi:hypothetical protein
MLSSSSSSKGSTPPKVDRDRLKQQIRAELERRRRSVTSRFSRWQDDPVGFVEDCLLGYIWSKQREILQALQAHRRVAVQSCHDVGKTRIGGIAGSWWLSCRPPGEAFLVSTAPTFQQVRGLLWREIGRIHREGGLPGRTNQTEWLLGKELVGFGRKPDELNPTAFQGIHARYVLVILDEACGVHGLWDAAESLAANDDSRILAR